MEKLARAIKMAAKIRERAHDKRNNCFSVSLDEACSIAARKVGYDERGAGLLFMLLRNCWAHALEWADNYDE